MHFECCAHFKILLNYLIIVMSNLPLIIIDLHHCFDQILIHIPLHIHFHFHLLLLLLFHFHYLALSHENYSFLLHAIQTHFYWLTFLTIFTQHSFHHLIIQYPHTHFSSQYSYLQFAIFFLATSFRIFKVREIAIYLLSLVIFIYDIKIFFPLHLDFSCNH